MRDPAKSFALIVAGLGFLYFGWVYSATGIFVANRGRHAVTAAEDPDRFALGVGMVFVVGVASLVAGLLTMLRR
jgi:hypothetical protein